MPRRRLASLVPAALAVFALVSCGGGTSAAGSGAAVVPASAAVYVSVATDEESEQWQRAGELVRKLPGGDDLVTGFLGELEDDADWETEVQPALGPETVFVSLSATAANDEMVVLTQPDDVDAFRRLAEKGDEPGVTREIRGWWAAAETAGLLERYERALDDGALADSDRFRDATGGLPEEPLLTLYAAPQAATPAGLPGMFDDRTLRCLSGGDEQEPTALAVSAEEGGFRIESHATKAPFPIEAGTAGLAERLPAEALAFLDGRNGAAVLRSVVDCLGGSAGLPLEQFETFTGISLEQDVLPLFEGESALAVYATPSGDPSVTLLTEVDDTADVLQRLDRHIRALGPLVGGAVTVTTEIEDGFPVRTVRMNGERSFAYAAADGLLAISNVTSGVTLLRRIGPSLAGDPTYAAARAAAGAPDETSGLLYVDVARIARLEQASSTAANTARLGALVLWGEADGDRISAQGFLAID
jgi:hypothetical protein